jgi:NitT/TauT family transport system permease protein
MSRVASTLAPMLLIALLLAAWEIACRALDVPLYFLPPPSAIAVSIVTDWRELLQSAWSTLSMALIALILASLISQTLALAVDLNAIVERTIWPLAVVLQVTPVVAIAPLVVIWAGLDHADRAIVALAAIVAFFPIFSGAVTGLKAVDPDLERLFDLYGAGPLQRLIKLRLPSAVPQLLEGHKVAAGLALIGAVVAEFVAGSGGAKGLAWRILEASHRMQTAKMFAAVVVLGLMGAGLNTALRTLERAGLRWWRGR